MPERACLLMHDPEQLEDDDDDIDDAGSDDSQDDEDKCDVEVMPPEHSSSWEWPLSRQEKKQRVAMIERQVHLIDKTELMKDKTGLMKDLDRLKSRYVRLQRRSQAGPEASPIRWEGIAE